MFKKSLVLRLFVAASSLAVVAQQPVFAEPGADFLGTFYDTSDISQWMVKYLGGQNDGSINETFAWQNERSYVNGVLDDTDYFQAHVIDGKSNWGSSYPWISVETGEIASTGYYSYVTTFNDAVDPTASFNGLSIKFSAAEHLHAVVINGVTYEGFEAQDSNFHSWMYGYQNIFVLPGEDITWNVNGNNTIEFVVHNRGWLPMDYPNPTGLTATFQASYSASLIPEPPVILMFATGLLVLPLARRLRKKQG